MRLAWGYGRAPCTHEAVDSAREERRAASERHERLLVGLRSCNFLEQQVGSSGARCALWEESALTSRWMGLYHVHDGSV